MGQNKLLTVREAAQELGITEQEVIDLAEEGKIPAYKIGGVYLRFKPEHVQEAKQSISKPTQERFKVGRLERLADFFYFNDFYILALLIIILMLIIIFRT
jgi:excisionase family DNA binding protein